MATLKKIAIAIAISNVICGCVSPASDRALEFEMSSTFTTSGNHKVETQWWTEFNDPTLNNLVTTALDHNFSIKSAEARLQSFLAQVEIIESKLYPTVNGTVNQDYSKGYINNHREVESRNTSNLGLNARWELDIWGKNALSEESMRYSFLENSEKLQALGLSIASMITQKYFDLIEEKRQERNLTNQIEHTKVVLETIELRYSMGEGPASAIWRQQQLIDSLQAALVDSRHNQRSLAKQINVLMGRTPNHPIDIALQELPKPNALPYLGIPAQLLEYRPDLKEAWYRYMSKSSASASLAANRLPNLSISTGINSSSESWNDMFDVWKSDLGVKLDIPLFDMGKRQAEYERAQSLEEESFNIYTSKVLDALLEVELAVIQEQNQAEQLSSIQSQMKKAKNILDIELVRYSQGVVQFLDVLSAQEKLLKLEQREITARNTLIKRRVKLYESIGTGVFSIHHNDGAITTMVGS